VDFSPNSSREKIDSFYLHPQDNIAPPGYQVLYLPTILFSILFIGHIKHKFKHGSCREEATVPLILLLWVSMVHLRLATNVLVKDQMDVLVRTIKAFTIFGILDIYLERN